MNGFGKRARPRLGGLPPAQADETPVIGVWKWPGECPQKGSLISARRPVRRILEGNRRGYLLREGALPEPIMLPKVGRRASAWHPPLKNQHKQRRETLGFLHLELTLLRLVSNSS